MEIFGHAKYIYLDNYRGVMPWEVYFNITFCRLVSFNMDFRDAIIAKENTKETEIKSEWDENRQRTSMIHNSESDYSFLSYLAYVTYLPLLIAGPVLTYNAFYSYVMQKPQQEVSLRRKIITTVQVIAYGIALDFALHYIYSAGFNERGIWKKAPESPLGYIPKMSPMTPAMVATNGFATLLYMYMKFMTIWRFFRVWALWDGINPPEV
jgi:D-alanyl-lipoteichoic acid acyltransferase DltB (MBOAT superfamily)